MKKDPVLGAMGPRLADTSGKETPLRQPAPPLRATYVVLLILHELQLVSQSEWQSEPV